jgi:pyridoxine 5-phosphate synthase
MAILLGVNIDHVATLRQARLGDEPDPLFAAHEAHLGGAEIITVHLREDRRHIQEHDVQRLAGHVHGRLNLEMGATDEMVAIALSLRKGYPGPQMVTLVPENRRELTTEGGLDVAGQPERMREVIARLKAAPGGMTVAAFIEADARQVQATAQVGFDACELHTGAYAHAFARAGGDFAIGGLKAEFDRLADAAHRVRAAGRRLHAGHALNYLNVRPVAGLPGMAELHIGHAIISRGVFVGLRSAVREMKALMGG